MVCYSIYSILRAASTFAVLLPVNETSFVNPTIRTARMHVLSLSMHFILLKFADVHSSVAVTELSVSVAFAEHILAGIAGTVRKSKNTVSFQIILEIQKNKVNLLNLYDL